MHIIKPCPNCNTKLRFPINTGVIKVRCICGYSFLADPDDPNLYANATFDLSYKKKKRVTISLKNIFKTIIENIYSYYYTLQNFTLLPTKDKIKVITITLFVVVIIILFIYYMFFSQTQHPENGIII